MNKRGMEMGMLDRRSMIAGAALAPLATGWPALARGETRPWTSYERETGGRFGIYAENLSSGARIAWRSNELFVMCSTFKFSLAALALARADRGVLRLDEVLSYGPAEIEDYAPIAKMNLPRGGMSIAEMCEAAIQWSDNTCANLVLARLGGPPALTAFWRASGDRVSRLDHNEPLLNRSPPGDPHDATTPAAMAGNVRRFILGDVLSTRSRDLLRVWIEGNKTGADRLRGGLPAAWRTGDKTGNNGKDAFSDIAVTWPGPERPIIISAYTQGGAPKPAQVQTVFAEVAQLVARLLA